MLLILPLILRFFRPLPFYTQLIGFLGDLFVAFEIYLIFPKHVTIMAQLFLLLDAFLYHKMHIRLRLRDCSHLRHAKTLYHSAQELGLKKFLGAAVLVVLANCFSLPEIHLPWWTGLLAIAGYLSLSKADAYAATNMFLQEQINLVKYLFTAKPAQEFKLPLKSFSGPRQCDIKLDPGERPHVLLIFLESFSAKYVGRATPNFDKLVQEGIFFPNFYSNGTLTYRALISGLFGVPVASTASGLSSYVGIPFEGLPEALKKAGYKTAFHHNGSLGYDRQWEFLKPHFDEIIDRNHFDEQPVSSWGVPDESLMRYTADWLAAQKEPAFATLFTISNHHPWIVPAGYQPPPFGYPSNAPQERFLQTTHYTDHALGLLVELLKEKNLDTILVIVGDHGQPMGEHHGNFAPSRFLYEENIHVPLLIWAGGRVLEPRRMEELGSHIDLLPTILDLLHLPGRGASLLRKIPDRVVMVQNPYGEGYLGCREKNWKWIENRLLDRGELYDLSQDPAEKNNLNSELADYFREKTRSYFAGVDSLYQHKMIASSSQFEFDFSGKMVRDEELIETISTQLQRLKLQNCLLLTDQSIGFIFSHCPDLTVLDLKGISDLTDKMFEGLKTPKLHYLDISDAKLTDQGIAQLMQGCPNLSTLFLDCENLTDASFEKIGPHLNRLHLFNAHHIRGLNTLLRNNRHLFRLEIDGCTHLTDQTLHDIKKHALEHLALIGAPQITDEGIVHLAELPLRSLSLVGCEKVTVEGLLPLLNLKLESLHLKNCQEIPPEALQLFKKAGISLVLDFDIKGAI